VTGSGVQSSLATTSFRACGSQANHADVAVVFYTTATCVFALMLRLYADPSSQPPHFARVAVEPAPRRGVGVPREHLKGDARASARDCSVVLAREPLTGRRGWPVRFLMLPRLICAFYLGRLHANVNGFVPQNRKNNYRSSSNEERSLTETELGFLHA
jgi:hypothetical protein